MEKLKNLAITHQPLKNESPDSAALIEEHVSHMVLDSSEGGIGRHFPLKGHQTLGIFLGQARRGPWGVWGNDHTRPLEGVAANLRLQNPSLEQGRTYRKENSS